MSAERRSIIKLLFTMLILSGFFCMQIGLYTGAEAQTIQLQPIPPQQTETNKKLTAEQQRAIEAELAKTGGVLTTEAINALKVRPELQGLTPEDIIKGKELLEKRERGSIRKEPVKAQEPVTSKTAGEEFREKTLFERSRQVGKYQEIPLDLKPFGYDFFRKAAVQISPEKRDTPVPLSYVIGPGDEIRLLLWGRVNAQYNLTVDRDGKITIPQIGPLLVAGMTFEEMSKILIQQAEQIVGTNIDISVGSVRTIPIFVLGEVRRPGSYTIGSLSTVTEALLVAGGPSEIGSMRKVQLKRKDKVVTTFDLYDLFLKGDKSRDLVLQAGDVVFVPVAGPLVGIAGNVKRPAIYEFKDIFDLQHLIDLAGGLLPSAYVQQIQVERILNNEKQIVIDINDKTLDRVKHFTLQNADLVKVFSIVEADENAIFLNGNVKRPGKYAFRAGMRIKDLIKDPEDLLRETYFDYALIKRLNPPGMERVLIPFNLGSLLLRDDAADNFELRPKDQVFIFSKWFFKEKPLAIIEGEIRGDCWTAKEADTDLQHVGRRHEDKVKADLQQRGRLYEDKVDDSLKKLIAIEDELKKTDKYDLLSKVREIKDELSKGHLTSGEIRTVQSDMEKVGRPDLAERLQEIETNLKKICRVELSGNMKIKDAILIAGGLTNNSFMERGEIVRVNERKEYTTLYFNVEKVISDDPRDNLILQDEDRIVIHSIWEYVSKKSVNIDGEVMNPGAYQYTEKMTVKDLVFKSGNVLESAYLDNAEITSLPVESGQLRKVVRKDINLKKALEGDPAQNLVLMPYDRVLVKRIPGWREIRFTYVSGEVKFPGKYPIKKGEKLSSLIERAGGFTDKAYLRGAYFTRERVRQLQQASLEEMTMRMERELLAEGAIQVSTAVSAEEIASKKVELEQRKMLVESLKKIKATGRMTIRLAHLQAMKDSEYDIELENGDALRIPEKNSVVNVVGATMAQGSIIYSDKMNYEDYINEMGGYSRYADKDNIFVLKVDGSARKVSNGSWGWSSSRSTSVNWNPSLSRWELAAYGGEIRQIEPGDSIVIPEKIERIAWLREIKDITQILMQIAVVAGVTINLF